MRIFIGAIGRLREEGERALEKRYSARIRQIGPQLGAADLTLSEMKESRAGSADQRRTQEADLLLKKCSPQATLIALDERGKTMSSAAFAKLLQRYLDEGVSELAFVLGGADGHGAQIKEKAQQKLSLSPMTLPHGLARIILLEQIYRALTILANHPYHRD